MLNTTSTRIHHRARRIVHCLLMQLFPAIVNNSNDHDENDGDSESVHCQDYEFACWLDALSMSNIEDFCKLVAESQNQSLSSKVMVGIAWEKAGLSRPFPTVTCSPILVTALTTLGGRSEDFVLLTIQVAASCLLFNRNPISLAALVVHCDLNEEGTNSRRELIRYAKCLLKNDAKKMESLLKMVSSCFARRNYLFEIVLYVNERITESTDDSRLWVFHSLSYEHANVASRLLLHIMEVGYSSGSVVSRCLRLLRRTVPVLLMVSCQQLRPKFPSRGSLF